MFCLVTLTYLELLLGVLGRVDPDGLSVGANDLLHLPVHVHHHVWVLLLLHHLLLHGRLLVHHLLLAAVHGFVPSHVHGVGAGCRLRRGSLLDLSGRLRCCGRFLCRCLWLLFRLLLLLGSGLLLFGLISHI